MYVSLNHPEYARLTSPASPREDHGQRLAEIPRGPNAVLRINLQEYQGRPYLSLRVWELGSDGRMWPIKGKGMSVRISEIAGVMAAMRQALDTVGQLAQGGEPEATAVADPDRPRFIDKSRHRGRAQLFDPGQLAAHKSDTRDAFDEIDGPTAAGGR